MAERFSKGPIVPTFKRFRWFPLATPEKYGGSFLKNAIKDAPNVSKKKISLDYYDIPLQDIDI